jgi:hypothetical protein
MGRRSVAEFLEEFVLPMVAGGEITVAKPLTATDVQHFEEDLPHATTQLVAVDEARHEVLSQLVVRPPAMVLDADELHLAASVHNLLFLVHPRIDTWTVRTKHRKRIIEHAQRFAARPLNPVRRRILARHALLHNVFDITRTDMKVSWWTGSKKFLGMTPPSRLTSWRSVRRVRQERFTATYDELLGSPDVGPVIATILRRSPLTQLLDTHPQAPPLHWEDAVFILRDPEMARAVSYWAISSTDPSRQIASPARFAAAFEQMLERKPSEQDLRVVAAFLVHLNVLMALSEEKQRDLAAKSPTLTTVLAPERAGERPRGLATFLALPNALSRVDPRLAQPPGLMDEPSLRKRWQVHRKQVIEGVGSAVIETLANRLSKHLVDDHPAVEVGDNSG